MYVFADTTYKLTTIRNTSYLPTHVLSASKVNNNVVSFNTRIVLSLVSSKIILVVQYLALLSHYGTITTMHYVKVTLYYFSFLMQVLYMLMY